MMPESIYKYLQIGTHFIIIVYYRVMILLRIYPDSPRFGFSSRWAVRSGGLALNMLRGWGPPGPPRAPESPSNDAAEEGVGPGIEGWGMEGKGGAWAPCGSCWACICWRRRGRSGLCCCNGKRREEGYTVWRETCIVYLFTLPSMHAICTILINLLLPYRISKNLEPRVSFILRAIFFFGF